MLNNADVHSMNNAKPAFERYKSKKKIQFSEQYLCETHLTFLDHFQWPLYDYGVFFRI